MGIKKRIERQRCVLKDDEVGPEFMRDAYRDGFKNCKRKSAQLAAEADELMAEMADTIEMLRACCTDMGADGEAAHTLHLYNQYKDQTND